MDLKALRKRKDIPKDLSKDLHLLIDNYNNLKRKLEEYESETRRNEERFRSMITNIPSVVWSANDKDGITFMSQNIKKLLGYDPEEITSGKIKWPNIIRKDDYELGRMTSETLFKDKKEFNVEYRVQKKDGNWIWIHDRSYIVKEKDGVLFTEGIFSDITKRKKLEEELEYYSEFETLVSNISADFINKPIDQIDNAINDALKKIVQITNGTRSNIYLMTSDLSSYSCIYEYSLTSEDSQIHLIQNVPTIRTPYMIKKLSKFEPIIFNSQKDVPLEAIRIKEWHDEYGFSPMITVPMIHNGKLYGALEINGKRGESRTWSKNLVSLLEFTAGIFVNVIERKKTQEELIKSEKNFRDVLDNAQNVIYMVNLNTNTFNYVSPSVEKVLGWTVEEYMAGEVSKAENIVHPDDLNRTAKIRTELENNQNGSKSTAVMELRLKNKNGKYRWFKNFDTLVKDENGKSVHRISSMIDINDIKEKAEKLRESEEKFRSLVNNIPDVLWISNEQAGTTYISDNVKKILGYYPEEITSNRSAWFDMVHEDDLEFVKDSFNALLSNKKIYDVEYRVKKKDGTWIWIHDRAHKITPMGDSSLVEGIFSDITKRKQIEKNLKESESKYRDLVTNANSIILRWDTDGIINFANEFALSFFGYTEKELFGRLLMDTIVPQKESTGRNLDSMIQDISINPKKYEKNVNENRKKNGEIVWISWTNKVITDEQGKVIFILSVGNDITDQKRIENERKRLITILESTNDFVSTSTPEQSITYLNKAGMKMIGLKEDSNYRDLHITDFHPKWAFELVRKEGIPTAIQDGIWRGESAIKNKNGGEIPVSQVIMSHKSPEGKLEYLSTIIRDITEKKEAEESLKKEKMFAETALNAQRDTFFVFEPTSGKIISWNKAFSEISGYSDEEISKLKAPDSFYNENDLKIASLGINRIIDEGESMLEMNLITKSGKTIPFEYLASQFNDEHENMKYIVSVGRDITERKKAEQKIKESEEKLQKERDKAQLYLDIAGVMFVALDADGRVTLINRKGCEILGYNEEEIIGKNWFDNFLIKDEKNDVISTANELKSGNIEAFEYFENYVLTKQNKVKMIAWHNTLLFDDKKQFNGFLSSGEDITERKEAEEELKKSEEKFRLTFEHASDAIFWVDLEENKITNCNKKAEILMERSKDEMIGKPPTYVNFEDDRPFNEKIYEDYTNNRENFNEEINIISESGKIIPIQLSTSIITINGRLIVQGIFRDISENKIAEKALRESEEKYRNIIESIPIGMHFYNLTNDNKLIFSGFNKAAEDILGIKLGQFIGKTLENAFPALAKTEIPVIYKNAASKGISWHSNQVSYDEGEISGAFVVDAFQTSKNKMVASFFDITDRIKIEEELRESEEKFRMIGEQALMAILMIQEDRLIYANKQFSHITGYSENEVMQWKPDEIYQIVHPDDREFAIEQGKKKLQGISDGIVQHHSYRLITKSKNIRWVDNFSNTILYRGKLTNLIFLIDITERKKAEEELKKSEEKFRLTFENAADAIFWVDLDTRKTINCNRTAEILLELNKDEIIGKSPNFLNPDELKDFYLKMFEEFVKNRSPYNKEIIIRSKSGKIIQTQMSASIISIGGKPIVQGIFHDITEIKIAEKVLQESEEKFRTIFESIPDLFFLVSKNEKILEFHGDIKEIYLPIESIIGKKFGKFISEETAGKFSLIIKRILKSKKAEIFEFPLEIRKNIRYYEARCLYFSESSIAIFVRNITKRKNDKKQLEFLVDLEKLIANISTRFISISPEDLDNKINQSLKEVGKFFNIDRVYLILVSVDGISINKTHEWLRAGVNSDIVKLQNLPIAEKFPWLSKKYYNFETVHIPDIELLPEEAKVEKNILKEGNVKSHLSSPLIFGKDVIGIIGLDSIFKKKTWSEEGVTLMKVTAEIFSHTIQHQKTQKAIYEAEEKYRTLVESSPLSIIIGNKDGIIIDCNEVTGMHLKLNKEEIIGKHFSVIIGEIYSNFVLFDVKDLPKDSSIENRINYILDILSEKENLLFKSGNAIDLESEMKMRSGVSKYYAHTISMVKMRKEAFFQVITQDVTEKKLTDLNLQKSKNELADLNKDLVQTNQELEAFIDSASHDLRAPLRRIEGFSEVLLEEYQHKLGPKGNDFLKRMYNGTVQMKEMLNSLLSLSLINKSDLKRKRIDMSKIVKNVLKSLAEQNQERLVKFIIQDDVNTKADFNLVHIILENLLDNAWKFTKFKDKTEIEFGSTFEDENQVFYIKDNGIGFDMKDSHKLFQIFRRLHSNKAFEGTGIGLATVKRIIQRHGGNIWADSKKGYGTTIFFTLK
jgi:PAS domain S-box-containing protein